MKIGVIGDAHLGSTDYSAKRRADFSTAFRNALTTCVKHGAEVICLLGDVFDSAATRRSVDAFANVLHEISPVLQKLHKDGVPIVAIPGNHEFGRGREAGELRSLEALDFIHVLRCEEFVLGKVGICGIPWQEDPLVIPKIATELLGASRAKRRILLIHNFVLGAKTIPVHLGEVAPSVSEGFDRAFAGHHHVYEEVGGFVIPGSTEVQNMLDLSEKCIIVYNTETGRALRYKLPETHRVLILHYDAGRLAGQALLKKLSRDLDQQGSSDMFIYIKVFGTLRAGMAISKTEILSLLRERVFFDYFVDIRYSTEAKAAKELMRGTSIDHLLEQHFSGQELKKAKQYLQVEPSDDFWLTIRESILS